jgi:hypothetical protein
MITGLEIINEVEDRLGWRQTDTLEGTQRPETRKLVRLLNRVLAQAQTLDDWPLLREDGTLLLLADETDTAYFDLTNGSATVSAGASDTTLAFDDSYKGRLMQIGSHATLYRVKSVESPTSLTLQRPWLGDDASDEELTYYIVQDRYFLPENFDRPTGGWENFFGTSDIRPVGPNSFLSRRRDRGSTILIAEPEVYTVYGSDDSETFQVIHFDPYPDAARILNFTYQKNHPKIETDEDRILFPKSHEVVIVEAMLQLANRDYEDNQKEQSVLRDLFHAINQAQGTGNVAQDRMRMVPDGRHRLAQTAKWRGRGRTDWGAIFDRSDTTGFD